MLYIFLISFFSLFSAYNNEPFISSFFNLRQSRPVMEIDFVDENITLANYINTYIPYSVFNQKYFQDTINRKKKSNPHVIQLIDYHKVFSYHSGIKFKEQYLLRNFNILISTNHSDYIPDQGLSLAYRFEDESYSFVHQLYNRRLIDHKLFSISYRPGKMHFGAIEQDAHLSFQYRGRCDVNQSFFSWGCDLNSITYDNVKYDMNVYAAFHTGFYDMFLYDDFYNLMVNEILKEEIKSKQCYEDISVYGNYIKCDEPPQQDKVIELSFSSYKVSVKMSDLFKHLLGGDYKSVFCSMPYKYYKDKLILGIEFFSLFNYVIFDYEKSTIEIVSATTPIIQNGQFTNKNETMIKALMIINSVMCLLFILFIIINKN